MLFLLFKYKAMGLKLYCPPNKLIFFFFDFKTYNPFYLGSYLYLSILTINTVKQGNVKRWTVNIISI